MLWGHGGCAPTRTHARFECSACGGVGLVKGEPLIAGGCREPVRTSSPSRRRRKRVDRATAGAAP
eukprot:4600658-Prymnesium_polylepis.1